MAFGHYTSCVCVCVFAFVPLKNFTPATHQLGVHDQEQILYRQNVPCWVWKTYWIMSLECSKLLATGIMPKNKQFFQAPKSLSWDSFETKLCGPPNFSECAFHGTRNSFWNLPIQHATWKLSVHWQYSTKVWMSTALAKVRSQAADCVCPSKKEHKILWPGSGTSATPASCRTESHRSAAAWKALRSATVSRMAMRCRRLVTSCVASICQNSADCLGMSKEHFLVKLPTSPKQVIGQQQRRFTKPGRDVLQAALRKVLHWNSLVSGSTILSPM